MVSAPAGPLPASISARCTHSHRAVSVGSRSFATRSMLRSPALHRRTTSALNSGVKERRSRRLAVFVVLSMEHSWRGFSPDWVSTKVKQAQTGLHPCWWGIAPGVICAVGRCDRKASLSCRLVAPPLAAAKPEPPTRDAHFDVVIRGGAGQSSAA